MPQDLQAYLPGNNRLVAEMLQEPICAYCVMTIVKKATQFYRYLRSESEFSFEDWGRNDDPGWLFIRWFDGDTEDATLIPLRQMALDLVVQGLLACEEVVHHKTAVVILDLSCLKLNSLPRFVTQCRNRQCHGFPLLGVDFVSSAIAGYGQQNTQLIFECMQTKLLLNKGLAVISNLTSVNKQNLLSQQGYSMVDGCFATVKVADEQGIA